ncbi:LOW QUALITY PROTEIN: NACHT, LRR and PYD domains-containing protein 12-like [Discoglossus pictus]
MADVCGRVVTQDDLQVFRLHLAEYEMYQLRILYEYFKNDLIYIVGSLDTLTLLRELSFRNILTVEYYMSLKEQCGHAVFSEMLVQDILDKGKEAVLGFWESLYSLQTDHPHPNLLGVLNEISQPGLYLEQLITLDVTGHQLTEDMKRCQENHKIYLLEKTQNLLEHSAPGFNQQPQCFPIAERYLDLIVVSSHKFRKRNQHEIIETGGIHEHYLQKVESRLERITPDRLFRWCHRAGCVPHSIIVSGVPGVGKSTLLQKFVYDWVNGKLYQRFAFIFFFKFRKLNKFSLKVSLESMILEEYAHLESKLGDILEEPDKLLFIFDGLDESSHQMDFKSSRLCTEPKRLENLSVIVISLVKQSLLKGCTVLMTSRPTRLASVETSVFQRVSEIMGFFPKQREMYFNNFFGNTEMAQKAFSYVRENGTLYTFCYIPSYCWIICTVLSMCFKSTAANMEQLIELLPKTVTQLFVTFITNIFSNHSQKIQNARKLLTSIGWMAEHGVMKHGLVFDDKDLSSFKVNKSSPLLSSFMIESVEHPSVTHTFFHLTIQEFLAALVHYLDYTPKTLQKALDEAKCFEDGRCEIFLCFICGLSDSSTRSPLGAFLGELSTKASKQVIDWLEESMKQDVKPEREDGAKRETLNIFAYLFESRNKALVSEIIGPKRNFDFSEFHLAPLDCTVLSFILEACGEVEVVDLDSCFIQTEGLERLRSNLHRVKELSLCNNDQKDADVSLLYSIINHPMCRIQRLSLRNNSLTETSCSPLACAISENTSLRELDLSKNKLAGPDFPDLMMALSRPQCRIENLSLQENKLTHEHTEFLLALTKNSHLTHLNLSYNFFSDVGYGSIRDLILRANNLKEIRLGVNDFSGQVEADLMQLQHHRAGLNIII